MDPNEMMGLPVAHAPHDAMRNGLSSVAEHTQGKHPVEEFQQIRASSELAGKVDMVRSIYGTGAAMGLKTEVQAFSADTRLPGLAQSRVGLDTVLNNDVKVGFEDVLGQEEHRPEPPKFQLHNAMEIKFGLL
uniref:Proteasome maturation factor UMP1 n=1 Tax=Phaeomonas parva TaxID=124430 RepID=A0A6U4HD01_9STRA|mmetsp:Transcript_33227/g.105075  ORF Transcript_33227/g.105075 Transcript_33227/m.105075 type:complete len:132 (+) Transcript_33227:212-607(+)